MVDFVSVDDWRPSGRGGQGVPLCARASRRRDPHLADREDHRKVRPGHGGSSSRAMTNLAINAFKVRNSIWRT